MLPRVKFPLGRTVITRNARGSLSSADVRTALTRHQAGDWGNLCPDDRQANEHALRGERRLVSAYCSVDGEKFWVITEWDRSVTTVLLPEDY